MQELIDDIAKLKSAVSDHRREMVDSVHRLFTLVDEILEHMSPRCKHCGKKASLWKDQQWLCGYHDPNGAHKLGSRKGMEL